MSKPFVRNLQRELDRNIPLEQKLRLIHEAIGNHSVLIHRVAVALYDPNTDMLSTFLHSSGEDNPLFNYSVKLSEIRSLKEIADRGVPRILNDLTALAGRYSRHTQKVLDQGYQSSLTYPLYHDDSLLGFLFLNSYRSHVFTGDLMHLLDLFNLVIASLVIKETVRIRTLAAAIRTAQSITRHKNEETGSHLERMSHYSRLIAANLAEDHKLNDEFIEYMLLFAPMHDIGKVAVPDVILLKPGKLTLEEFEIVKQHPSVGRDIIDNMVKEFSFDGFPHIQMLRNIVELHHEAMDGSGYPGGMSGEQIPIEARICAVADIFDALTSRRCYKPAWDNEKAFSVLREMANSKLDGECVEALIGNAEKVMEIQAIFAEEEIDD
ncbi:MAG: HD domain-containing protein [Sulfurimicrobium sp.]|nr:HD domain-containing protein [Sulfurimicrobium sp.]